MKTRVLAAVAAASMMLSAAAPAAAALKTPVFAGGCFWSVEKALEAVPGVVRAVSGYSGGANRRPTYENHKGHLEAVRVTYDPAKVSYAKLLDAFFHNIDPTDPNGQFCDQGESYRTAVFVADAGEQRAAEAAKAEVQTTLRKRVATEIRTAAPFYDAEDYHQDFAKKNPRHYNAYRVGCGRDRALKAVWAAR